MNELMLYGSVGASFWGEEYFTLSQVRDQLAGMDGPVTVRLNSGGGFAEDGQSIYTMLVDYPGEVHVVVDGAAASAASLIAMAGDTITMRLGAFMLIHDPAQMFVDGRGTSDEHKSLAAQLDILGDAYAAVYARRAGMGRDEARAIMRADTMFDGEMAVAQGFATAHDADTPAAAAASFDYRIYANAPADLVRVSKELGEKPGREAVMAMMAGHPRKPKESTMADKPASQPVAAAPVTEPKTPEVDTKALAQQATIVERTRMRRIMDAVAMARVKPEMATQLIDEGATLEDALDKIREAQLAAEEEGAKPEASLNREQRPTAKVGRDARDKFREGAEKALMAKVGLEGGERNEFSSLTLAEMARESILMAGERKSFTTRHEMVGHAFTMSGMHSTSDFSNILANTMGKAVLAGWDEQEETFHLWTRRGILTDFKTVSRAGLGLFGSLPVLPEGAEYKAISVDDRAEPITLATYGSEFNISRQAIINDDLGIFNEIPRKLGRAARRTVGDLAYGVLTANAAMADGTALFHADHNNLAGSGTAPSVTSFGAARAAMRVQKEKAGGPSLNIRAKYVLLPGALETAVSQLLNSTVDPTTSKGHASNPVAGMVEPIVDGRLDDDSTTAWYLAGDPNMFDTVEIAYLDGNDTPRVEQMTAWSTDGVKMKVAIDAAAKSLDYRALYKNAGT